MTAPLTEPADVAPASSVVVWETLCLVLAVGAAGTQRSQTGIQLELLLALAALAPLHLRRLLSWQGALPPLPWWANLLELAAWAVLVASPRSGWALALALGANLPHLLVVRPTSSDAGRAGLPLVSVALALIALLAAPVPLPLTLAPLLALLLVAAEALDPRGARGLEAGLRRLSAACLLGAVAWVRGGPWLLLLGATALAAPAPILNLALVRSAPEGRERRLRRWWLRLLAPVVALTVAWGLAEVAFRLVPNRYTAQPRSLRAQTGKLHAPGEVFEFRLGDAVNRVRWNRHGWHDVDHALKKPPDAVRILVAGDSFVEGVQVPLEQLYHRHLQRLLSPRAPNRTVETIAYGWSGWGQRESLHALTEGRAAHPAFPPGLAFDPDLVVIEFLALNDIRDNWPPLERAATAELARTSFAQRPREDALTAKLYFSAFLFEKLDHLARQVQGRRDPLDIGALQASPKRLPQEWAAAYDATRALFETLRDTLKRQGIPLLVVIFSSSVDEIAAAKDPSKATPELDWTLPRRRVTRWCKELAIPCLDLPQRFAALPEKEWSSLHLAGDGHWSEAGHRKAAEETAKFLLEEKLWDQVKGR